MQHLEFAEYVEKELKGTFKSNEFIDVTKIALEAKLSNKIISREKSEAIIRLALKISDIIYKRQNLIAVSYTHLDVYKRQPSSGLTTINSSLLITRSLTFFNNAFKT